MHGIMLTNEVNSASWDEKEILRCIMSIYDLSVVILD